MQASGRPSPRAIAARSDAIAAGLSWGQRAAAAPAAVLGPRPALRSAAGLPPDDPEILQSGADAAADAHPGPAGLRHVPLSHDVSAGFMPAHLEIPHDRQHSVAMMVMCHPQEASRAPSARKPVRKQGNRRPAIMTDETVSATTTISTSAEAVFAVLADPSQHAAIDGTGW